MRKKHTYCFDNCAMLPYHLGLELRGGGLRLRGVRVLPPSPPEYATEHNTCILMTLDDDIVNSFEKSSNSRYIFLFEKILN